MVVYYADNPPLISIFISPLLRMSKSKRKTCLNKAVHYLLFFVYYEVI